MLSASVTPSNAPNSPPDPPHLGSQPPDACCPCLPCALPAWSVAAECRVRHLHPRAFLWVAVHHDLDCLMSHGERIGPEGHFLLNVLRTPLADGPTLNLSWGLRGAPTSATARPLGKRKER